MNKKQDDAISAVIALMLVLAILSTCIAVYTSTYIPGLKQQAEITHSEDVRLAFERLSSDADNLYAMDRNASFTQSFSLGGGDVALSPSKSVGTMEIENETVGTLRITDGGIPIREYPVTTAKITYTPSRTTWERQGYEYVNGVVWVCKDNKKTPSDLNLRSIDDGLNESMRFKNAIKNNIVSSFVESSPGNFSISLAKMFADADCEQITGSGIVKLRLCCTLSNEKILLPGGTELSYRDSSGTTTPIKSFDSNSNLTVNLKNTEVSLI